MTTPTPQDYALEPCPFCGTDASESPHTEDCYFTLHERLRESGDDLSLLPLARVAWNRRVKAAPQSGWTDPNERMPEWVSRDDTPCVINGKEVPPTLFSETVLVALQGGGVRTDKRTTIEGKSEGWWHTYGERVIAWQPTPPPPSTKGEPNAN